MMQEVINATQGANREQMHAAIEALNNFVSISSSTGPKELVASITSLQNLKGNPAALQANLKRSPKQQHDLLLASEQLFAALQPINPTASLKPVLAAQIKMLQLISLESPESKRMIKAYVQAMVQRLVEFDRKAPIGAGDAVEREIYRSATTNHYTKLFFDVFRNVSIAAAELFFSASQLAPIFGVNMAASLLTLSSDRASNRQHGKELIMQALGEIENGHADAAVVTLREAKFTLDMQLPISIGGAFQLEFARGVKEHLDGKASVSEQEAFIKTLGEFSKSKKGFPGSVKNAASTWRSIFSSDKRARDNYYDLYNGSELQRGHISYFNYKRWMPLLVSLASSGGHLIAPYLFAEETIEANKALYTFGLATTTHGAQQMSERMERSRTALAEADLNVMRYTIRGEQYHVHSMTANFGNTENEFLSQGAARLHYAKMHPEYKQSKLGYALQRIGDFLYDALKPGTTSHLLDRAGRATQAVRDRRRHDARDSLQDFISAFADPGTNNPYLDTAGILNVEAVTLLQKAKRVFDQKTWSGAQFADQDFRLNFTQVLLSCELPRKNLAVLEKALDGANEQLQAGFSGLHNKPLSRDDLDLDGAFTHARALAKSNFQHATPSPAAHLGVTLMTALQDLEVSHDLATTCLRKQKMVADLKQSDKYISYLQTYLLDDLNPQNAQHQQLRQTAQQLVTNYQAQDPQASKQSAEEAILSALVPVLHLTNGWRSFITAATPEHKHSGQAQNPTHTPTAQAHRQK